MNGLWSDASNAYGECSLAENDYEYPELTGSERLTAARKHARELLLIFERGYSMPMARAEQLAQHIVSLLGCDVCGLEFADNDVAELAYIRRHGVCVTGDCIKMAEAKGG